MDELNRKYDVLNMRLSMHSILRDRYHRTSTLFKIVLLISSVILNTTIFMDYQQFSELLSESNCKLIFNIFSILTFAVSLIILVINLNGKAESHSFATKQLTILLSEIRDISNKNAEEIFEQDIKDLNNKYNSINNIIIPIPEKSFNKLKAKHLYKKEFSKYISNNKGLPFFLIKIKYFYVKIFKKNHEL